MFIEYVNILSMQGMKIGWNLETLAIAFGLIGAVGGFVFRFSKRSSTGGGFKDFMMCFVYAFLFGVVGYLLVAFEYGPVKVLMSIFKYGSLTGVQ